MTRLMRKRSPAPAPAEIEQLLTRVAAGTGLSFTRERRELAAEAIGRAMSLAGLDDAARFGDLIERDETALDAFLTALTVGETYFFREPGQFEFLRAEVLPQLARVGGGEGSDARIRVWSAGCASGEEPYSIAMMLHEAGLGARSHVVGTDISRARLQQAREARYGKWSLRGVSDQVIRRHFRPVRGRLEVLPAIRCGVTFQRLNLADPAFALPGTDAARMQVIFCRNVLIYFDAATIERVARRLLDALSPDGWLFLGASDPALADVIPCDVIVTGAGLAYRRSARGGDVARWSPSIDWPAVAGGQSAPSPAPRLPADGTVETLRADRPAQAPRARAFATEPAGDESAAQAYAARRYERAAELARRETESDASNPTSWIVLIRALANMGRLTDAGAACATGLDRHPASPELAYLHALLLAEAGLHSEAATAARRALYLDRALVVGHMVLGDSLAKLGDIPGARRAFRNASRLLEAMPDDADVPASDGDRAGRLAAVARTRLALLVERAE